MKKILYLFQILLKFSLIFFIVFIWLKFLLSSLWVAIVLSLAITIIVELVLTLFSKKKNGKKALKLKEKENAENMFLSLVASDDSIDFFERLAKTRHKVVVRKKDYILITNQQETLFFPFIKMQNLSLNDIAIIVKLCKSESVKKCVILCYDFDKNCLAFTKNFDEKIIILDRFDTFSLYKEYDFYPEITMEYKKEAKLSIKDLIAYSFNKSRTKGYVLSAIFLFLTSFFVNLNIYYCITASILLLFALISFINPKFNNKTKDDLI
jgi:hypothetical protein